MNADHHRVGSLIDKLLLEMLDLTEQQVQSKIQIEKATGDACIHLAKARYITGQQAVSALQLPSDNSNEFTALATVAKTKSENTLNHFTYELDLKRVVKDSDLVDPIKWFGVLLPSTLHLAQLKFRHALNLVVESVNIQSQLKETITKILQLTKYKNDLKQL